MFLIVFYGDRAGFAKLGWLCLFVDLPCAAGIL